MWWNCCPFGVVKGGLFLQKAYEVGNESVAEEIIVISNLIFYLMAHEGCYEHLEHT